MTDYAQVLADVVRLGTEHQTDGLRWIAIVGKSLRPNARGELFSFNEDRSFAGYVQW
jgi:hypothetical protein